MMIRTPIRYIALDFDNVICELNAAFQIVWNAFEIVQAHEVLRRPTLREEWLGELERAYADCKISTLNPDVLMILKHVVHTPEEERPTVFIYTNNPSEERVAFVHDWIELVLRRNPWTLAFHPQDPRRSFETEMSPHEPGKSLAGMRACLENPDDFTAESVLFLDDLLHPIRREIGSQYIHVNPPFRCEDALYPYLKSFVRAYQRTNPPSEIMNYFNLIVANCLKPYVKLHPEYFPAMQDLYLTWDGKNWEDYFAYLQFGISDDSVSRSYSLKYYTEVMEFLKRHEGE
jgi:hypothetical protein